MTQTRVPPPQEPVCLSRPYPSSQKGGTLIAESVLKVEDHLRKLAVPDCYRPSACPSCESSRLHVHDYRSRLCQLLVTLAVMVVRYRCVDCGGRWQVLPAFIARHLSYNWPVVEDACGRDVVEDTCDRDVVEDTCGRDAEQATTPAHRTPSERTRQRWLGRLFSSGRVLVQLLATSAKAELVSVAQRIGLDPTRWELLDALAQSLSAVATLTHRLMPGVRLM